jgi:RimJ/RimL family protein N-acetyltransferase
MAQVHELKPAEYDLVRPLFDVMDHHLAVQAILAGSVRARVYVDHPTHPWAALTWTGQRFYLAGSARKRSHQRFVEMVYAEALQAGSDMFVLYYAPDGWADAIDRVLGSNFPVKAQRQFFVFRELRNDWRAMLPEGVALEFVDGALLEKTHLKNREALVEEMRSERESVADFLDRSFGVCLIQGDEIAGWCLSEYNTADRCEVGIATLEPYRGRAFATVMASALVEHALSQGVSHVGWHCYAHNLASVATALKVGFQKVKDYPVYLVFFDEGTGLAVNGNACFREQRYEEALGWYETAFERGAAREWVYWGAARASAVLGRRDAALRYLAQAIDRGFKNRNEMMDSEHLRSLHGAQEWKALMGRLPGPQDGEQP